MSPLSNAPGLWSWQNVAGRWYRVNEALAIQDGPHTEAQAVILIRQRLRRHDGTPSAAARYGRCPACLGGGVLNYIVPPPEHDGVCHLCAGTGLFPWPPEEESS